MDVGYKAIDLTQSEIQILNHVVRWGCTVKAHVGALNFALTRLGLCHQPDV